MFIKPDYNHEKLIDIDFNALKEQGKTVLMFDLDSTVMPSKSGEYPFRTRQLLTSLQKDFTVVILTNNTDKKYIERVRQAAPVEVISDAGKPRTKKASEYLKKIGKTPVDTVIIGDRPLTDILVGKFLGSTTVLVDSITKDTEPEIVRFVRKLERLFIRY